MSIELEIFKLFLIITIMSYLYYNLRQKIENSNKQLKQEIRVLNQKISGLSQLIISSFKKDVN